MSEKGSNRELPGGTSSGSWNLITVLLCARPCREPQFLISLQTRMFTSHFASLLLCASLCKGGA